MNLPVEKRALDRIGSALLEKKLFEFSPSNNRDFDTLGNSLWHRMDRKSLDLDYIGYPLRGIGSVGSSFIDGRAIDKIGSSILRKRAG